ncbi:MAG: FecR domain-containing protein [Burkholderiales bacterium]|nr:FecR domain-containing protein [Burkholderiales bacterium]
MLRSSLFALCFGLSSLIAAPLGYANGIFQSVSGDVRAAAGTAAPVSVSKNQSVVPGTTVTTGNGAQTVIRFDDGHTVVLNENTEFLVAQYSFDKDKPQSDNIAMRLLKGAMRSVSGLIVSRSRNSFALLAPQATIGIRGTDFMIALVNPAYLSVLQGSIAATNTAGTATFAAGATATVASATALAVAIPASALPASVAASFSNLSSVAIGAGAGAASGAAAGGVTAGMVAAGAAVIAVAVGAASSESSDLPISATNTNAPHPF